MRARPAGGAPLALAASGGSVMGLHKCFWTSGGSAATAAVIMCLSGCVAAGPTRGEADPAPGAVHFDLAGPGGAALTVPVKVNGAGPYPFVLDTGATVTCVDDSLVRDLSLPEVSGALAFGGTISGLGRMRLISLDSISVGEATVRELRGCAVDLSPMRTGSMSAACSVSTSSASTA